MFDNQFQYHVFKDYDIPFDEKGTTCGTVRKVQWIKGSGEPDESKAKIEIRKVYTSGAEEKTGKGYTFSTPEGPGELACTLLKLGHANTKDVIMSIKDRDDFRKSLNSVLGKDDEAYDESAGTLEDDFYDPREVLGV